MQSRDDRAAPELGNRLHKGAGIDIGPLPPLQPHLGAADPSRMARSAYFPIGGRNALNNKSSMMANTLGVRSQVAGGLRSTYAATIGAHGKAGLPSAELAHLQAFARATSSPALGGASELASRPSSMH
eukprot:CAMPEP_0179155358 /NCGR_PEP_ID=MMETSP0796-20121207/75670_1 /TAXON_ID=73915 /ORGANISM="Pyrodinium bahamense, Strain pbaha01" /LENGTH=127 /DNA_ID=CAMNT_0020856829 /DNA_START=106 /DNA_END=490 /DNA_ORIENTATION=+